MDTPRRILPKPLPGSNPYFNPYVERWPFYNHPVIRHLAFIPKWTWTMPIQNEKGEITRKIPVDMAELQYGRTKGCDSRLVLNPSTGVTVDLEILNALYPNAPNNTFFLTYMTDGYVCLDVEPECPDDLKAQLCQLPYAYGEPSMSGHGLHLFFPTPALIQNYPDAMFKTVLKEEHGYYEVLLNHWVTFTRMPFGPSPGTGNFDQLFENLCKQAVAVKKTDFDITANMPDLPKFDMVKLFMSHALDRYDKTPADFAKDERTRDDSAYEFGYEAYVYRKLHNYLNSPGALTNKIFYSMNQRMWALYLLVKDHIPYRPKHDTLRDGMPFLLYTAKNVVACVDADIKEQQAAEEAKRVAAAKARRERAKQREAEAAAKKAAKAKAKAEKAANSKGENKH